jgi:hypothetical protein
MGSRNNTGQLITPMFDGKVLRYGRRTMDDGGVGFQRKMDREWLMVRLNTLLAVHRLIRGLSRGNFRVCALGRIPGFTFVTFVCVRVEQAFALAAVDLQLP